jgi:hypothetical protein
MSAPQPEHRRISDGVDAAVLQSPQPRDGIGDAFLLVPQRRIVCQNIGAEHEDMFMDIHRSQRVGWYRTPDRLHAGALHVYLQESVGDGLGAGRGGC